MKRVRTVALLVITALFAGTGIASSAVSFSGQGNVAVDSLTVGKQGSGGVTYFNGSIANTTKTGSVGNPVTFGDDVRIDGRVWRGATAGTADAKPFSINDNAEVAGNLAVSGSETIAGNQVVSGSETVAGNLAVSGNETVIGTLAVTGSATVGGLTVQGMKRYEGTLDPAVDGDEVTRLNIDAGCVGGPTSPRYNHYHYKKIAVPEITLAALPSIRIFVKPQSTTSYTPNYYPNSGDVWVSAGYVVTEGFLYYQYKYVFEKCDGTLTAYPNTTGEYKILVVQ